MLAIKQMVAPLVEAQTETRTKVAQLKEACVAIDRVLEWSSTYTQALDTLPKRGWLDTQNDKAQMRVEIQTKEKLAKDLERVMNSYGHLNSGMESMIAVHQLPPVGPLTEERTWQQIEQDIKGFIQPFE